ncbi:MAG: MFS transporter [Solirubrobacteraceae bacterium]
MPIDDNAPLRHRHTGWALAVISTAQLMVMLDVTVVNVALPSIQRALGFSSTSSLEWVITAYVITFGGLLLLGGRSGDRYGRRRMFAVGVSLFALSSLAGGMASSQAWLIAARAVQGVGAAIASPTALSLITTTFAEGRDRHRAMAVYAGMSGAGGALGLLLGGVLTDLASWRWVLFVNVPIGVFVVIGALLVLDRSPGRPGRLDFSGAFAVTGGVALLVYGFARAADFGWSDSLTIVSLVGAVLLLIAFVTLEAHTKVPLMPLSMFASRNRAGGYAVMLLVGAAMLSLIFFSSQYFQDVRGYSPVLTGVSFLPVPFMVASISQVVSRLVGRIGTRVLITAGPLVVAGGLLWLSLAISTTASYAAIVGPLVLTGFGMGLTFVPITLNAVSGVSHGQAGLAAALLTTSQQIGGSLGVAVLVTVSSAATETILRSAGQRAGGTAMSKLGAPAARLLGRALVSGYADAFHVGALMAAAAFLLAVLTIRGSQRRVAADPEAVIADAAGA